MRFLVAPWIAVWLLTITGPALAQAVEYRLGAQDRVMVTVFGEAELSGELQVDGTGRIAMPLVGDIEVGGLTVREAEAAIANRLQPDFLKNPRVGVQVTNYRPFYILGEIKQPGSYPYVSGMTVVQAVALAGGFTYRARQNRLYILRGAEQAREKIPATQETVVLPGDIIEVPERFF
jgi:polysaccharide export outer membrane protein